MGTSKTSDIEVVTQIRPNVFFSQSDTENLLGRTPHSTKRVEETISTVLTDSCTVNGRWSQPLSK